MRSIIIFAQVVTNREQAVSLEKHTSRYSFSEPADYEVNAKIVGDLIVQARELRQDGDKVYSVTFDSRPLGAKLPAGAIPVGVANTEGVYTDLSNGFIPRPKGININDHTVDSLEAGTTALREIYQILKKA